MHCTFLKYSGKHLSTSWRSEEIKNCTLRSPFIYLRVRTYVAAINDNVNALRNCVGFIDVTVLVIARQKKNQPSVLPTMGIKLSML